MFAMFGTGAIDGYLNLLRSGGWEIRTRQLGRGWPRPILMSTLLQVDGDVLFKVQTSLLQDENRALFEQTLARHLGRVADGLAHLTRLDARLKRLRAMGVLPLGYGFLQAYPAFQAGLLPEALLAGAWSYGLVAVGAGLSWFAPNLAAKGMRYLLRRKFGGLLDGSAAVL